MVPIQLYMGKSKYTSTYHKLTTIESKVFFVGENGRRHCLTWPANYQNTNLLQVRVLSKKPVTFYFSSFSSEIQVSLISYIDQK